jgi:hypothetical protein
MNEQIAFWFRRARLAAPCVVCLAGVAGSITAVEPAQAFFRNYNEAWCAQMGDGINDCSYFTWQQCRAAASGTGNFCYQNPLYVAPADGRRPKRKYRRD